jgi:hypothetical protein
MTDAIKYQTMNKFIGINNLDDPTRLVPIIVGHEYAYPLQKANNVEIDNSYAIKSRGGYASVKSGTNIHSLWSDGVARFYVDYATLYQLLIGEGTVTLRSDLTVSSRMSYVLFNDKYYYTNDHQVGYVKNSVSYGLQVPSREFKEPLPAGHLIEVFMGCLLVAKDNILYIGDPLCDYYDVRTGYRQFVSDITLLRAVDTGLYIADRSKTFFVRGKSNEDFERDAVYQHGAIPFTDVQVLGSKIDQQIKGNVAMWTAEDGICLGDNSGNVMNLTDTRYVFTKKGSGTGFIRETSGVSHYINSLY